MSDTFNGYHVWLGIPANEQPPNHYRLLGIALFETDLDVIDHAADRQMAHVRTFQSGRHQSLSQQILNELAAARLCLLNAEKKTAYDESLRARLGAVPKASPVLVAKPLPKAQAAANAVPYATPVAAPVAGASNRAAAASGTMTGVKLKAAPVSQEVTDLDLEPIGGSTASIVPNFQLRSKRRGYGRGPSWQRPLIMGILAAVVVTSFMLLYVMVQWLSKHDWRQVFDPSFFEPATPAGAPAEIPEETSEPPAPPAATPAAEPTLPGLKRKF